MTHGPIGSTSPMLKSFLDPRNLGFVIFYVTNRCNFRCPFCFYYAEIEKGRKPDELSLDEIARLAESIGPLLQLSLTGGEPFVRRELGEIIDIFIKHTHARYITIPTNAWLTDTIVATMTSTLERNPDHYFRLVFSIEAIGERHDEIRAMPGSYAKILASYDAISPLRKRFRNLVLDANSVFSAASENTLMDTLSHLDNNFDFDNLSVTYARGDIPNEELKKVSADRYRELNDFLEARERTRETRFLYPLWRGVRDVSRQNLIRTVFDDEFVSPCVAGRKLVVVSETGMVYPCEVLGKPLGNLRDFDFDIRRLLRQEPAEDIKKWIVDSKCKCSFECALSANVVWRAANYPKLISSAIRNIGR